MTHHQVYEPNPDDHRSVLSYFIPPPNLKGLGKGLIAREDWRCTWGSKPRDWHSWLSAPSAHCRASFCVVSISASQLSFLSVSYRAWNGPGAQIVRPVASSPDECEFIWLMDCEYRGWIPSGILDLAMPIAQMQFAACVRKLAKDIKEGKVTE